MSKKKTRQVEYFRCWDDHTWDTDFIDIPADTPEDKLNEAVQEAAFKIDWKDDVPAFVGVYCDAEEEEPEQDEEDADAHE